MTETLIDSMNFPHRNIVNVLARKNCCHFNENVCIISIERGATENKAQSSIKVECELVHRLHLNNDGCSVQTRQSIPFVSSNKMDIGAIRTHVSRTLLCIYAFPWHKIITN